MSILERFRLPYREDSVFSTLALAVFVVPMAFSLFTEESFEIIKLSLFLALVGGAWILWLLERRKGGAAVTVHPRLFLLLGLFVGWAAVASMFSYDPVMSLFGFYPRMVGSVLFYTAWAAFAVLLYLRLDAGRWRAIVTLLFIDAVIIAAASLLQSYGIGYYENLDTPAIMRAPGFLGNPNFTAMFLAAVAPLALARWVSLRGSLPRTAFQAACIFLILWATVTLTSRGALLGLLAGLAVFAAGAVARRVPRWYAGAAIVAAVVVLVLTRINFDIARPGTLGQTVTTSERNIDLRVYSWGLALDAMRLRPLVGTGPAVFQLYAERYQEKQMAAEASVFDDAHSLVLQTGATTGVVGALLLCVIIGLALYIGAREFWTRRDTESLAMSAGLVSFMVSAAFSPVPTSCYLLLAVLVVGLYRYEGRPAGVQLPRWGIAIASVAGLALIVGGVALLASDALYHRGRASYFRGEYERAYRLNGWAARLNPANQAYLVYQVGSLIKLNAPAERIQAGLDRVVAMHPGSAGTYDRVAGLYVLWFNRTGQPEYLDRSIQNIGKALELEPWRAMRYRRLAFVYFQNGKLFESKETVKNALILDQKQLPAWGLLARIYQIENNRPAMLHALEKSFELFPEVPQAKRLLEIARSEQDVRKVPLNLMMEEGRLE